MSAIKTDLADAALSQIVVRVADHRLLTGASSPTAAATGRHLRDIAQMRHNNALVDLVAIAEFFTAGLLLSLRPAVNVEDVGTWVKRCKAWQRHCGVDLAGSPAWRPLQGFAEARNSLQHGLGRLTDRQLGKYRDEVIADIAFAGLRLNGDRIEIAAGDVGRCAVICEGFIRYLDANAPSV